MTEELKPILLKNGVKLSFEDQSNRYFGDFHRVCILVTIEHAESRIKRQLDKMGVTSERLGREKKKLIDSFLKTSLSYLEREDFPEQLSERVKKENKRPIFLRNL